MPAKPALLPPAVLRFLRVMAVMIAAEALVMFMLARLLPPLGNWWEALVDSTLLTLLVTPLLWRWLVVSDRQRRRAEEGLRLQSAALTAAANAILITDRDGTIVWVNPAFTTLTGYPFAEAIGKNPRDLVKADQQKRAVYQNLWETILAGRVWHGELVNRRKDGSLYPEDQTITPVRDAAGEITHFIAIKQDLTEPKRAEAARRASEEQYRSLFENMAEGLAYCQMLFDGDRPQDFVYLAVNHAFETLTGLKNVVGRKVTEIIPGVRESDPALFEVCGRVAQGGAPERFENFVEPLKMWFEISVYCPRQGFFVAVFDVITERKEAEAALRLFRTLIDHSNDVIIVVDPSTARFVDFNERACRELGYTRTELMALTVLDVAVGLDQTAFNASGAQLRKLGHLTLEREHRRKDGSTFPVEVSMSLATLEREYIVVIARNITERKQAEEALRTSERKFQSVFEQAAVGVVILSGHRGHYVNVNRHFCEMVGYTAEELRQMTTHDTTHPDDLPTDIDQVEQISFGIIREFSHEKRFLRKDGTIVWAKVFVAPLDPSEAKPNLRISVIVDITARKQAEAARRASEERYRLLIERAPDVIFAVVPTGAITSLNHAFETITGWPLAEWLGRPFEELIHPDDRTRARERFQMVRRGEERTPTIELRVRTAAGGFRDIEITGFSNELSGDRIEMQGIGRDITERKQAAAALRDGELQYRTLADSGQALIWSAGPDKKCDYFNQPWLTFTGRTLEQELGDGWAEGVHPDDLARCIEIYTTAFDRRERFSMDYRLRRHDGQFRWIQDDGSPRYNSEGNFLGYIGHCLDITERRQAGEVLRQSEERHRLLFENNPLSMWVFDVETLRFLAVNDSAVRHYGYTREEFLAMTLKDIRPEQEIPALGPAVAALNEDSSGAFESRHRRKNGSIIQVEVVARLIVFDGHRARLVLASDVTEKKLLDQKFLHAQRIESIGMLAAGIAHDLNNVLSPIVFAAPLLRGSLSGPRDLKILDTLERSAGRGAGLVKQILGFAHGTTGEFRSTQVKHLARDIISVIEETFPKSIQFEHQIPSDLWPVQGNATQIHQVLLNLCVNARDAMPLGGTLRLTAANRRLDAAEASAIPEARPGPWVVIEVADTGTGIPPELLERIWTPFFTTKGAGKGTGLGLSTVRGIVASHRGFVELDTEAGRGSTFRVFLPALESESSRPGSASPFVTPDGRGELILVVDDDAPIRETVTAILEDHGYRAVSCIDGVEALALFNARRDEISVVVTDADMPRLGGAALARALLQLRPDLRLIAMSGGMSRNATGGAAVPELQKLAHAFLLKPFIQEDLLGAVHRLLHPTENP